ncbi:MAG: PAS domain S-box protein [Candidatus Natronoplasma sp.]
MEKNGVSSELKDKSEDQDIEHSALIKDLSSLFYRSKNDKDRTMESISGACLEITGYKSSELIHNEEIAWGELIKPEDRERIWKEIQDAVRKDEFFKIDYRLSTKEGKEKWVWDQGRAIRDPEGEIEALEGFITDITEEVRAKKKAKERERKIKKLYEAATRFERCKTNKELFDSALKSAKDILGFYTCAILMEDDGEFVVKAKTKKSAFEENERVTIKGLGEKALRKGEASLVKDVSKRDDAGATKEVLKSGVTVPVGDKGVFATASDEVNYYDEFDLEMAKTLASHIYEGLKRIESEREKSLILDTTEELVVYQDADFNVRWVNRAAAESVDEDIEALQGKKCYQIWHHLDQPCEGCPVKKAKETGKQEEGERKDRHGTHWLVRATPKKDDEGNITGVVEIALDITERKEAKEKLKDNKERIKELLGYTSRLEKQQDMDTIYDTAVEAAEKILDINMGGIYILENDKLVLKAKSSEVPDDPRIDEREKDRGVAGRVLETKEPDITGDFSESGEPEPLLEIFEEYRSGITVPIGEIGIFQAMSKEKYRFSEDDLDMLELLFTHVVEAKERVDLHEKLKESEERYRTIFEHTGTAMMIIEEDMTISLVNEKLENISGYPREELEGEKKWTEFVFEEDRERMKRYHKERREDNKDMPDRYTFRGVTRFGDVRHFLMEISMIPNTKKSVASLIDVTEYRKTFGALRESQEAFRILFENITQPIILIEKDKTVREVNDKFMEVFGQSMEDFAGSSLKDILDPDTPERIKEKIEELLLGKRDKVKDEIYIELKKGEKKPVELDLNLIKDTDEEPSYAMGILYLK